ncbi:MAG: hypothetical protein WCK96_09900 [Methylococcales bacterium]
MSTPDFYSLNQVIIWLQQLHEKQVKGSLDATFEIKNYLNYQEMPSYSDIISSDEQLCFYAGTLFSVNSQTITFIRKRLVTREHCWEVTVEIANELIVFFIKKAWEGAIKEAIGLEFNNLLTDTPIRYLCGQEVIITEKVFEPLPTDTLYELRESEDYIFAFGAWEIFTNLLRLTDRKTTNVRWSGSQLANIDFGLVFYKGKPVFDSRFTLTKKTEQRKQGQIYALEHILSCFNQHHEKLETLLFNIDVHFCRRIPCPRIPREPVRILFNALKKIDPEILASNEKSIVAVRKELVEVSVLKPLLNIKGILYAAIINSESVIIDEIESVSYRNDYELTNSSSQNPILNSYLLDLIIKGRDNSILKTADNFKQNESIQIDLTNMRLLAIWNNDNNITILTLLELDVSVAHIKVNIRKVIYAKYAELM